MCPRPIWGTQLCEVEGANHTQPHAKHNSVIRWGTFRIIIFGYLIILCVDVNICRVAPVKHYTIAVPNAALKRLHQKLELTDFPKHQIEGQNGLTVPRCTFVFLRIHTLSKLSSNQEGYSTTHRILEDKIRLEVKRERAQYPATLNDSDISRWLWPAWNPLHSSDSGGDTSTLYRRAWAWARTNNQRFGVSVLRVGQWPCYVRAYKYM